MRQLMTCKWLLTHALVIGMVLLFLGLGWWQLGRGEAGNARSYAYSLEWPTFALLVIGFWAKIVYDELHPKAEPEAGGAVEAASAEQPTVATIAGSTGRTESPARSAHAPGELDDAIIGRDDEDAELAAYNRYVADLARQRGRR